LLWLAVLSLLVGLAVGLGLHFALAHSSPSAAIVSSRYGLDGQAAWPAGAKPAPVINTLPDQSGQRFSLASLRGHTVAIVFFDSHCHQECPLEGRALAAAERGLPLAQRPVLVAVSVNPLDTAASARRAVRAWGLAGLAPWHWLMGGKAELSPVWGAYRIFVGRAAHGDIPHTEAVYLVDRRGYERSAFLYPFAPRFVTHDLRALAGASRS
jgi:cytochrome oxidase Cu insertion factor (SCO1/SenC/PrrC family)